MITNSFSASTEAPSGMKTMASEFDKTSVQYIPDVAYAVREGIAMHLHMLVPRYLLSPENKGDRLPLLVFVQGSGWGEQNMGAAVAQLSEFAHAGYVVASVQHRPTSQACFPAQIQDVKSAIRYLIQQADQYHIDTQRIALWGDSSGAHTVCMAAVTDGLSAFDTGEYGSAAIPLRAVVDFYGPTHLQKMNDFPCIADHESAGSAEGKLIGGAVSQNPEAVAAASPMSYIRPDRALPPFLIMHGDTDSMVPFNQSVLLYSALQSAQKEAYFYKVTGAGHGTRFWIPSVLAVVKDFLARYV